MNDTLIGFDYIEEDESFPHEVSDEMLEAAADTGNEMAGNFTNHSCTITPYCPG
jgi:hypothetical protein